MEIQVHDPETIQHQNRQLFINIAEWICQELRLIVTSLDIIFSNDFELRSMHKKYLSDDSNTDVMTFNLGEKNGIEAEIYISTERASQQARQYNNSMAAELTRLIIHGCLHLADYDDRIDQDRLEMKRLEDLYVQRAEKKFFNTENGS